MRHSRRGPLCGLAMMLALTAGGCRWWSQRGGPEPATITLVVSNRTYFDVTIYAVRSLGGTTSRLATVSGNDDIELQVRQIDLTPAGELMLRLHAIGSNSAWTSPAVPVDTGTIAHLEIYADAYGNLSRSTLYTAIAARSAVP